MNLSGTFNALRVLYKPSLCTPSITIGTFNQLPLPINEKIKAVVLDKDNCFAYPKKNEVWNEYGSKWNQLKELYPGRALLIVSNSAGSSDDIGHKEAEHLEKTIGVHVLRHSIKKPGCRDEILTYFGKHNITSNPKEIAVVGDRLFTDIMMANLMGSYSVWVKDGVLPATGLLSKFEKRIFGPSQ